jgi:hypothetical protein
VEFLNEQMDPAEVLAIEVKQYLGTGVKTLVPRVVGQTETARQKKSSGTKAAIEWNEELFMKAVRNRCGEGPQAAAKDLLDWIAPKVSHIWWGRGSKEGGIVPTIVHGKTKHYVCRMATQGWFIFRFDWLSRKPPFSDESLRRDLLKRINEIPGVQFSDDVLTRRTRIPFRVLTNPSAAEKLKETLAWLIEQVKSESASDAAAEEPSMEPQV